AQRQFDPREQRVRQALGGHGAGLGAGVHEQPDELRGAQGRYPGDRRGPDWPRPRREQRERLLSDPGLPEVRLIPPPADAGADPPPDVGRSASYREDGDREVSTRPGPSRRPGIVALEVAGGDGSVPDGAAAGREWAVAGPSRQPWEAAS